MSGDILGNLIYHTAWTMDRPQMFGTFHIAAALTSLCLAVLAYYLLRNRPAARVLPVAGWILVLLEIYKQLFIFHMISGGEYNWWYFPFQLCSIPMYLCILLPLASGRLRSTFLTFLAGYSFTGAAAALIFPEDFLRPYIMLTLHGFIWHGILLFISLTAAFSHDTDLSHRGTARAALLFICLSIIAVCINIATEPVMALADFPEPYAAMFYMNPYHVSPQPVVGSVQEVIGIPAGLALYALSIIAAASIIVLIFQLVRNHPEEVTEN